MMVILKVIDWKIKVVVLFFLFCVILLDSGMMVWIYRYERVVFKVDWEMFYRRCNFGELRFKEW